MEKKKQLDKNGLGQVSGGQVQVATDARWYGSDGVKLPLDKEAILQVEAQVETQVESLKDAVSEALSDAAKLKN